MIIVLSRHTAQIAAIVRFLASMSDHNDGKSEFIRTEDLVDALANFFEARALSTKTQWDKALFKIQAKA